METLGYQELSGPEARVEQYLQDAESLAPGAEERSHLAQLCMECILLFRIVLKTMAKNNDFQSIQWKTFRVSLARSYGRLKIWSEEHGAADGNLDATLAVSPRELQRDALKYIVNIGQSLTERLVKLLDIDLGKPGLESISDVAKLIAAVTEGNSDNSSDSELSDSSSDTANGVLEDLRADTTCLQDLEPLLCSPILRTDPEPTDTLASKHRVWREPYHFYCDKVSERFPMAADDLVNKVGTANYDRFLRCQKQRATMIQSDQKAMPVGAPDNASSNFYDSGIGSSLHQPASVYAETVMSYGTLSMDEGRRIRVPPLPALGKQGLPFECVACGKMVNITTNSAWKRHLYMDLRPWICLEADCQLGTATFPTRNDWTDHLALEHGMSPEWSVVQCPLCRVEIGPGKPSVTGHMSNHLEEISLSALPADCEFEEESEGSDSNQEGDHLETSDTPASVHDPSASDEIRGDTNHPHTTQGNHERPSKGKARASDADYEQSFASLNLSDYDPHVPRTDYYDPSYPSNEPTNVGDDFYVLEQTNDELPLSNSTGSSDTAQPHGTEASPAPSRHSRDSDEDNTVHHQSAPALIYLPCELSNLTGCHVVFPGDDEQGWMDHVESHLQSKFPSKLRCWFCSDQYFDARQTSGGNTRFNFVSRMQHIRHHLVYEGFRPDQMVKDGHVVQHLFDHNLIDRRTYDSIVYPTVLPKIPAGESSGNRHHHRSRHHRSELSRDDHEGGNSHQKRSRK